MNIILLLETAAVYIGFTIRDDLNHLLPGNLLIIKNKVLKIFFPARGADYLSDGISGFSEHY